MESSTTFSKSFFPPASLLHLWQMFSYTTEVLVQWGIFSAFWLQVVQSFLPHLLPSHSVDRGNLLLRELPHLSTIFIPNPRLEDNAFDSSLILFRNSPPSVFSTKRTDLYTVCSLSGSLSVLLFSFFFLDSSVLEMVLVVSLLSLNQVDLARSYFLYLPDLDSLAVVLSLLPSLVLLLLLFS